MQIKRRISSLSRILCPVVAHIAKIHANLVLRSGFVRKCSCRLVLQSRFVYNNVLALLEAVLRWVGCACFAGALLSVLRLADVIK